MSELNPSSEEALNLSYFAILLQRVLELPESTPRARRKAYTSLEADLLENLGAQGFPEEEKEVECRHFRQAIRLLERDIRGGVDVAAAGYLPGGIVQSTAILYSVESPVIIEEPASWALPEADASVYASVTSDASAPTPWDHGPPPPEDSYAMDATLSSVLHASNAEADELAAAGYPPGGMAPPSTSPDRMESHSDFSVFPEADAGATSNTTSTPRSQRQPSPEPLDTIDATLSSMFHASNAEADELAANLSPQELTKYRLKKALLFLGRPNPHELPGSIRTVRAMLIYQFNLIAGESRIAIFWMLIQPAILLALIGTMYMLSGTQYVLNMDVPTFALLGAGTWIMCRQVIFRVSTQMAHHRILINFPSITPLMQGVTQGLLHLIIYSVSIVLLIAAGRVIHMTSLPDHLLMVIAYVVGMWIFALSFGFIFGTIAIFWPYFLRLASVIERALQLVSSVFFVSEQLPEEYKGWVLWCPTAHGLQLLRASYFDSYPSSDASPSYFWISILILVFGTFLLERSVRPYVQPI